MATIRQLADELGLLVAQVKLDAGLERTVASGTELTVNQEQDVRIAARDRAMAGMPVIPAPMVEEPVEETPVEVTAEEVETPPAETIRVTYVEPEVVEPEPEQPAQPEQPEPEVVQPEPEVVQPEPEVVQPEPEVVQPEPEQPAQPNWLRNNWWWLLIVAALFVAACLGLAYIGSEMLPPATPVVAAAKTATPTRQAPTARPTETRKATESPKPTEPKPTAEPTLAPTEALANTEAPAAELKTLAEKVWGEPLPEQPEPYSAHAGEEGYPDDCAGLCWDTSKLANGVMMWYGPNMGEEDISESDAKFGDGSMGPLDLMRSGKVTKVIFYIAKEAQLETCAIGSLDGVPLTKVLNIAEGECGERVAIQPGWHVVEDNANSPIAGFGVRLSASGWATLTESQIVTYTSYWKVEGNTATWIGPDNIEIMMTPAMVSMMQDMGVLTKVVFTTKVPGKVLFCNGVVSGSANLESPDGSCQLFDVPAGTFTYTGEARLSAGISWQPQ